MSFLNNSFNLAELKLHTNQTDDGLVDIGYALDVYDAELTIEIRTCSSALLQLSSLIDDSRQLNITIENIGNGGQIEVTPLKGPCRVWGTVGRCDSEYSYPLLDCTQYKRFRLVLVWIVDWTVTLDSEYWIGVKLKNGSGFNLLYGHFSWLFEARYGVRLAVGGGGSTDWIIHIPTRMLPQPTTTEEPDTEGGKLLGIILGTLGSSVIFMVFLYIACKACIKKRRNRIIERKKIKHPRKQRTRDTHFVCDKNTSGDGSHMKHHNTPRIFRPTKAWYDKDTIAEPDQNPTPPVTLHSLAEFEIDLEGVPDIDEQSTCKEITSPKCILLPDYTQCTVQYAEERYSKSISTDFDVHSDPKHVATCHLGGSTHKSRTIPSLSQRAEAFLQKDIVKKKKSFERNKTKEGFTFTIWKNSREYIGIVPGGEKCILQGQESEVDLMIPSGLHGSIIGHIHTHTQDILNQIPDGECLIAPVPEYMANVECRHFYKKMYIIKMHHCVKEKSDLKNIIVRTGDIYKNIPFTAIPRKPRHRSCKAQQYYMVSDKYIKRVIVLFRGSPPSPYRSPY